MEQIKQPFAYSAARAIATKVCNRFMDSDCVEAANIAGSIRRKKQWVKDIEILVMPKQHEKRDLFQNIVGYNRSDAFMHVASQLGRVIKGNASGRYMQIELPEGITLDLFIPERADYARQLAIRTGSADYTRHIIAAGWKRLGWVGTEAGLRRQHECEGKKMADGKTTWKCIAKNPTLPPVWQSEDDFFEWIGLPGAPLPERREM